MVATIRTLVEQIISPAMGFYYGRDDFNNLEDDADFPAAFLAPLVYDVIPHISGYKQKRYEIILMFFEKAQLDFKYYDTDNVSLAEAHATLFATTDSYIDTFLNLFEKAGLTTDFSVDASSIKVQHLVNVFDTVVSGSMLTMTVTVNNTNVTC